MTELTSASVFWRLCQKTAAITCIRAELAYNLANYIKE